MCKLGIQLDLSCQHLSFIDKAWLEVHGSIHMGFCIGCPNSTQSQGSTSLEDIFCIFVNRITTSAFIEDKSEGKTEKKRMKEKTENVFKGCCWLLYLRYEINQEFTVVINSWISGSPHPYAVHVLCTCVHWLDQPLNHTVYKRMKHDITILTMHEQYIAVYSFVIYRQTQSCLIP